VILIRGLKGTDPTQRELHNFQINSAHKQHTEKDWPVTFGSFYCTVWIRFCWTDRETDT